MLLLHGWPQTWHAWRRVAASLADHTVVLPDLRGFGNSAKPAAGYDAATMAADIHGLLAVLRLRDVTVVGHDWGAVFAYVLAATYPADVAALGIVEMLLPGIGMLEEAMQPRPDGNFLWHMGFQSVPDIPELLLRGNERPYLRWFFEHHAYDPSAISPADIDEYVGAIEQVGALRASLAVYRALFETAAQVAALAASPLAIPVIAYGGDASLGALALAGARVVAPGAEGGVIPRCGHWAPEERRRSSPNSCAELVEQSRTKRGFAGRLPMSSSEETMTNANALALATIAGGDEGEAVWALGGLLIFKVSGAQSGGRVSILEERMLRGCATPANRHTPEPFVPLEGGRGLCWGGGGRCLGSTRIGFGPGGRGTLGGYSGRAPGGRKG